MSINNTSVGAIRKSPMMEVVGGNTRIAPQPPSKHRFVGREHRQGMFQAWRNRLATLGQLKNRNKGLRQRDIESAILDELDERERKVTSLIETLRTARSTGDGPVSGPSAVSPARFGGALLASAVRNAA